MATHFNLQHQLFSNSSCIRISSYSRSVGLDIRKRTTAYALQHANSNALDERNNNSLNSGLLVGSLSVCYTSLKKCSSLAASAKAHFSSSDDQSKEADEVTNVISTSQGMEISRVDCVVWLLHESSRSFSKAINSLGVAMSGPALAMAWIGKDVHEWHRRIAYQVAVYALMKAAIDLEILLSHERLNEFSPVKKISELLFLPGFSLSPLMNQMGERIEIRLKMKHPYLVQWFRETEMPRIAGYFIPLLKKWSVEYAGRKLFSGIAGIIVAITCCSAVVKLGARRICCPLFVLSLEDALVKLMDFSLNLAPVDKLHWLATEAGFELNFLSHFGGKVFPSEKTEDLEFWIGLAHKKLLKAFCKESITSKKQNFQQKIQADNLATLGLFTYLGKRTRIFLSAMGIKDLDGVVKNFLSYLECGILFIYPEFSSIRVYQCFMEVVTDEIGWLDFYGSYVQINCKEKRSKHNARQAEKEIISSVVFTVCYDVFSGFAHFNRTTQQSLDTASRSYLLRCESLNTVDHASFDNHTSYMGSINGPKLPLVFEVQQMSHDLTTEGCPKSDFRNSSIFKKAPISAIANKKTYEEDTCVNKSNPQHESFIKRYSIKLASTSADLWMGTVLLFIDIMVALELLVRQVHGCKASESQRKKLHRTMTDIIVLIPVTILMLIPVTAVGHAAILAAIKKYMPFLIPSSFSSERLDVVKLIKQTRKMGYQLHSAQFDLEDQPATIS
ncbi:Mitochondrial proton/calcium exchanger protein [Glycine max]|nr:Mitochondrial proton/calcium exchanger protein [Glycine max]